MSRFDDQINRMRELCTYGRIDEDEKIVNRSIEHKETAANGVTYGIIRECSKFYIESCPKGKENLVEAYDYLGGFNNKKDYEYTSYPMALKQFRIKMDSINESVHAETDTDVIEAQNQQLMTEGGSKMQNEIARMKQIMRNAAIVMNESSEMMTGAAAVGKSSDKNTPFTDTVKACENGGECAGGTATDPEKQGEPFEEKPKKDVAVNEEKACCDESEEDFDADADDEELDPMEDENPEITDDEPVDDEDELADEDEEDDEPALELGDEESDDEADFADSEVEDETPIEDEEPVDDVQAKIAELQAQIDALKAQAGNEDVTDMGGDEDVEVEPIEDEPMGDESDEFDFDEVEDFSDEDSEPFEDDDYLSESRKRRLNRIVESIIGNYKRGGRLNEDELHDFGGHPGYRKKPFSLPPTGEDSNAHGKDINHDSVHNEKPFGQSKGDSTPFSILVDRVYKDIAEKLMEANRSKMANSKKKVK